MTDVLIRNVPAADLDELRAAAAADGVSLQRYLRETVHAQARYLRRQETLARLADRMSEAIAVPPEERAAVREAIDDAHTTRAANLGDRSRR